MDLTPHTHLNNIIFNWMNNEEGFVWFPLRNTWKKAKIHAIPGVNSHWVKLNHFQIVYTATGNT